MRRVLFAAAAAAFVLAAGGCGDKNAPQTVTLQATSAKSVYTVTEPVQLTATLANGTNGDCAVVASSVFGFAIEKLTIDGKPQSPVLRDAVLQNGVAGSMSASAVTLRRGQSDAPRRLDTMLGGPPALPGPNLVVGAQGGQEEPAVAHWRTDRPGHYEVTLVYRPFQASPMPENHCRTELAHPAVVAFDVVKDGSTVPSWSGPSPTLSAGFVGALVVLWLLLRHRRRVRASAALVAVVGLTVVVAGPAQAVVGYNGPDQSTFAGCRSVFEQPGGDPDGAWRFAQDPGITVTVRDTFEPFARVEGPIDHPDVFWNAKSTAPFHRNGPTAEPCGALYHELAHIRQAHYNEDSLDWCWVMRGGTWVDTDIPRREVEATRAENRIRSRLGLEPRRTYGIPPRPLPADNEQCSPVSKDDPFPRYVLVDFTATGHWGAGPPLTSKARFVGRKTAPCTADATCRYKVPESPEGSAEIVESPDCQGKAVAPPWSGDPIADLTFTPETPSPGPSPSGSPTAYRLNWRFSGQVLLIMKCGGQTRSVTPPIAGNGVARWRSQPPQLSVTTQATEFPDRQVTATITLQF